MIGNPVGSICQVQGGYAFSGELNAYLHPAEDGVYDYILSVKPDESRMAPVSYGLNTPVSDQVYVAQLEFCEVRVQLASLAGAAVEYRVLCVYKDGRPSDRSLENAELRWNVEQDPYTGNYIASDRIGTDATLYDSQIRIRIIIASDRIEVIANDTVMEAQPDSGQMHETP